MSSDAGASFRTGMDLPSLHAQTQRKLWIFNQSKVQVTRVKKSILRPSGTVHFLPGSQPQKVKYLIWKNKYGHVWTEEEDAYRRVIFTKKVEEI